MVLLTRDLERKGELLLPSLVLMIYSIGYQIVTPILSLYYRALSFSAAEIGFIYSFLGVGMLVFEPIWGWLCDRTSIRRMIVPTILLTAFNITFYAWNRSVAIFALLEFLHGVLASAVGVAGRAMMVDLIPSRRGRAFGLWRSMYGLGAILGPLIGGLTAQIADYLTAFYLSTTVFGTAFLLALKSIHIPPRSKRDDRQNKSPLRSFRLVPIIFMVSIYFFTLQFVKSFVPIYLIESTRFTIKDVELGLVFTTIGLIGLPTQILVGSLSDRFGRRYPVVIGLILCSSSLAAFPSVSSIFQLYLVISIYSIGGATTAPCLMAALVDISPFERGTSMGIYGAAEDIGIVIRPAATGLVYHYYGVDSPFMLCAVLMLINTIIAFFIIGHPRKTKS
ncbi:MAG: MFS transporter [Thermoproteota archaeon]